jgi:hypothetical protein
MLAPPTLAAVEPSKARKMMDVADTHKIKLGAGANTVIPSGSNAPTAKLAADARAA